MNFLKILFFSIKLNQYLIWIAVRQFHNKIKFNTKKSINLMIKLRHIGIVARGDLVVLKNFYKALINPHSIRETIEQGEELDSIIGINNAKIETCKLYSSQISIEIIKYINPVVQINNHSIPAFSGINHIAFTVDDFEKVKNLVVKNGGFCEGEKYKEIKNSSVKFVKYLQDPENNILEFVEN